MRRPRTSARRPRPALLRADGAQPALFTAAVDEASAAIRARGHLDRLGADLLRGTIEGLQRRGHQRITLRLRPLATVDAEAFEVLVDLALDLSADGVQLIVE